MHHHHVNLTIKHLFKFNYKILLSQNISLKSVKVEPQIAIFAELEDTGLLKEMYTFTYTIDDPDILKYDLLGWVIAEEASNANSVRTVNVHFSHKTSLHWCRDDAISH